MYDRGFLEQNLGFSRGIFINKIITESVTYNSELLKIFFFVLKDAFNLGFSTDYFQRMHLIVIFLNIILLGISKM